MAIDRMNPTDGMLAGREAGRRDCDYEIEKLQTELDYAMESLDEYKGETRLAYDKAMHDIDREIRHGFWQARKHGPRWPEWLIKGVEKKISRWQRSHDMVVKAFVDVIKAGKK